MLGDEMSRTRVTENDVLRLIVQRRLRALPEGPLEIQSHDLTLALGRDVVDFWLGLHRRDWVWTDVQGRSRSEERRVGKECRTRWLRAPLRKARRKGAP